MPTGIEDDYYSIGGNRHSAAADWSATSGLLAFGADQNVALWSPSNDSGRGISTLLSGHSSKVTAIKFFPFQRETSNEILVTGSASGDILIWKQEIPCQRWNCVDKVTAHDGTVNTIAVLHQSSVFVTGGADGKIKLWRVSEDKLAATATLLLRPRFIPLTLALGPFPHESPHNSAFLVAAGTRNDIQVYAVQDRSSTPFKLCATLTGHEAWIRSLALTSNLEGGYLLASASQDKYVRIWRLQPGDVMPQKKTVDPTGMSSSGSTLTAKVQNVSAAGSKYSITFEALLLGHEDWIYSAAWSPRSSVPRLLTASADGSLSIWEADPASGIWISVSRLGEISGQKGATTATGSTGGFWMGLWAPDGKTVTCLGRTGSWRVWEYVENSDFWTQKYGVNGHVSSVNGICWAPDGSYLLSTSSDQTTRLHAEWKRGEKRSWHEFSRPQIHGYDLNCIVSTNPHQFSSGADEKLLRVFNEPKDIAGMLYRLCQIPLPSEQTQLPDTAAIPVLGLSNKAMDDDDDSPDGVVPEALDLNATSTEISMLQSPPTEDLLARHTLWPEHEKLYGHGYEISEAATPLDGSLLATACKASSIDHAVIRLYDTKNWNEIKPPLTAHSLTVTRLAFSSELPEYLLSVGRDRQWAVFKQAGDDSRAWIRVGMNGKAHARMILDAAWLSCASQPSFATAGRDKVVKLWSRCPESAEYEFFTDKVSIARKSPVTAISATSNAINSFLAVGEDDGSISLHVLNVQVDIKVIRSIEVEKYLCPSKTVNRLAWRPHPHNGGDGEIGHLAVASADGSIRILRIALEGM
ncbi:uncharacterized protein Z518_01579 [Rhinocladiella mackenziei CBS 650.93]|uniref:Elongator complex protein 2 n=1 Tax=Rhinocladiella mackenziei CBS 650.93 TaxID=1442369 RepID=A0A0D2J484_9EURO|nr:uncharacterized protein Z518_01579 [Rhinocladiella mackenziei CBS 650.93]KIX10496.1 hypothetical protein Z518_01579 [Rhinocladiella mackenziei CBS 650.93]